MNLFTRKILSLFFLFLVGWWGVVAVTQFYLLKCCSSNTVGGTGVVEGSHSGKFQMLIGLRVVFCLSIVIENNIIRFIIPDLQRILFNSTYDVLFIILHASFSIKHMLIQHMLIGLKIISCNDFSYL